MNILYLCIIYFLAGWGLMDILTLLKLPNVVRFSVFMVFVGINFYVNK